MNESNRLLINLIQSNKDELIKEYQGNISDAELRGYNKQVIKTDQKGLYSRILMICSSKDK